MPQPDLYHRHLVLLRSSQLINVLAGESVATLRSAQHRRSRALLHALGEADDAKAPRRLATHYLSAREDPTKVGYSSLLLGARVATREGSQYRALAHQSWDPDAGWIADALTIPISFVAPE